ncbi:hypothetical protein BH09VER1_BH09VER1_51470 [soil metagenome]
MMMDPHAAGLDYNTIVGLAVMGVIALGVHFLLTWMLRLHLGMNNESAMAFGALVTLLGVGSSIYFAMYGRAPNPTEGLLRVIGAGLFVIIGVPLWVKIYRAWIGMGVTPGEGTPGSVGFRAWLSPLKLMLAVAVALSAYFAYHIPLLEGLGISVGLLLVYPIGNSLGAGGAPEAVRSDLGPERERVLSMLEAGRITADESAELLSALAATQPAAEPGRKISSSERRALVGAVIVLIAFFLPWYKINPAAEMQRLMGTLNGTMGQVGGPDLLPGMEAAAGVPSGTFNLRNDATGMPGMSTISVSGGDLKHGLGWVVLFCGLGAALLPIFGSGVEEATRRMVRQLALGVGTIILIYLISSGVRYLGVGLLLAALGYVLEITALAFPKSEIGGRNSEVKTGGAGRGVEEGRFGG